MILPEMDWTTVEAQLWATKDVQHVSLVQNEVKEAKRGVENVKEVQATYSASSGPNKVWPTIEICAILEGSVSDDVDPAIECFNHCSIIISPNFSFFQYR